MTLYDLVISENFNVDKVTAESYVTKSIPGHLIMVGDSPSAYDLGYSSKIIMDVTPQTPEIPIKKLKFDGFSAIRAGDHICEKISVYTEKKIEDSGDCNELYNIGKIFYFERDLNSEESAIELSIYSPDRGKIVRSDRAIDYERFIKK